MFVPPENRQPGPPPWLPPKPKQGMSKREETVVLWVMGCALFLIVVAPIGGSTVIEALWYIFRR